MIRSDFARALDEKALVRPGETVLLALSGGPDSTALAHLFAEVRAGRRLRLRALHLNYGLRGAESDEDERFVRALSATLDISLGVRIIRPFEAGHGESLQMAARRVRYAMLDEEAAREKADRIATGHTRDDRIETLLINLLRGAGPRGLGAIPHRRGKLIRPLLDISREEISAYLAGMGVVPRIDRSNLETDYDRNKIRLELLPFAENLLGRPVRDALARSADIFSEIEGFLEEEADRWIARHAREEEDSLSVPAAALAALPLALARQTVRALARRAGGFPEGIRFERTESVLALLGDGRSGRTMLSEECEVRREGEALRFGPPVSDAAPFRVPLPIPGAARLPDGSRVLCRMLAREEARENLPREGRRARLDFGRVRPPLLLRARVPGDRFRPLGAPGGKKLQDLLVDRKIPRSERSRIPVLCDSEGILWVIGIAIADRAKVAESTRRILEVAFCPPPDDTNR